MASPGGPRRGLKTAAYKERRVVRAKPQSSAEVHSSPIFSVQPSKFNVSSYVRHRYATVAPGRAIGATKPRWLAAFLNLPSSCTPVPLPAVPVPVHEVSDDADRHPDHEPFRICEMASQTSSPAMLRVSPRQKRLNGHRKSWRESARLNRWSRLSAAPRSRSLTQFGPLAV
jgi:hypothetical protein